MLQVGAKLMGAHLFNHIKEGEPPPLRYNGPSSKSPLSSQTDEVISNPSFP